MTDDDVIRMIRDLPDLEPPPGWQERLRERLEREWAKEHGRLREIDKTANGRPAHYVFDRAIIDRCIVDEQPSGSFEIAPGVYVTPPPDNVRAAEDGAGIDTLRTTITPNAPTGGRSGG